MHRHLIDGEIPPARDWGIGTIGIAGDDRHAGLAEPFQPGQQARRETAVVEDVAGQQHVDIGKVLADPVGPVRLNRHAVRRRVERDRCDGEGIDVDGLDMGRPGAGRRDRHQPGAGGEIEHALAAHGFGMVEDIAREPLPARPGEGPEGRRQVGLVERRLGQVPERCRLVRLVQADLRHEIDRREPGLVGDEARGVGDQSGLRSRPGRGRRARRSASSVHRSPAARTGANC